MSAEMDEIWALFVDDGTQAMDAMETALLELDPQSGDTAAQGPHIAALFRAVHTFKGNSRVLGLGVVESRAHLAEDLIGLIRDEGVPLDAEIHALLLETGDRLRDMLEVTAATHADVDPAATEDLVARLRDKIARCTSPAAGQPQPAAEDAPAAADAPDAEDPAAAADAPAGMAATPASPDDGAAASADPAIRDAAPSAADPAPADPTAADPAPTTGQDSGARPDAPAAADSPADPHPAPAAPAMRLADDPTYRRIFDDMVADALTRLQASADPAVASRVVTDLAHAATQLGLDDWSAMLASHATGPTDSAALIAALTAMPGAGATQPPPRGPASASDSPDQPPCFLSRLQDPLAIIARIGIALSTGEALDTPRLTEAAGLVRSAADAEGYVRVSAAAAALPQATDPATYRRSELRLYEELAAVEDLLGEGTTDLGVSPATLRANWCADHVFDTLDELDRTLERLRRGEALDQGQRDLERLVRLVHHACRHYGLNMASQLAMSLLDLFGRGHAHGEAPDAILMRIARGFIDTLELVFDALREGEAPDTERLEQLFREASEVGFTGAGVMTATAVERKLGLPAEFHRVLSPESTRAAAAALAEGAHFHILRADVNDDNTLAEALFDFIGSGAIQAITNVTVFEGQKTIFDFLIATTLNDMALAEAMASMDPGGKRLILLRHLVPLDDDHAPDAAAGDDTSEAQPDTLPGLDLSAGMLERIGEIAAGQAMVHGMLGDLVETDLGESIESVLRLHGQDPRQARLALRALADRTMDRLRDLAQLETQLLGHMAELQQSTSELRSRPVETVLRPLVAMVATQSRSRGGAASMTTSGAEMQLDIALLDTLKRILRPLVLSRLGDGKGAPRRLHLAVNRSDDQLSITLDDDTLRSDDPAALDSVTAELTRAGGNLRRVRLPGGGERLHLSLPMNLVVLEGMVVGAGGTRYVLPVDAIRTILQPDPAALLTVAVGGGQKMLRLSDDEVIAVRPLPTALHAAGAAMGAQTGTAAAAPHQSKVHVVLGRAGQSVAIPVDDLVGQQLVLLRPLRGLMARLRNISGVALLSGGDVGMVLSPRALCDGCDTGPGTGPGTGLVAETA
jgi:two-component system, chemotaxis family, sensor kinase CheA